jgi:hypothetical protein
METWIETGISARFRKGVSSLPDLSGVFRSWLAGLSQALQRAVQYHLFKISSSSSSVSSL